MSTIHTIHGKVYVRPLTGGEWTDLGWTSTDGLSYHPEPSETVVMGFDGAVHTSRTVTMAFTPSRKLFRLLTGWPARRMLPPAERLRDMHRAYRRRRS